MGFHDDLIHGLNDLIGKGKRYKNVARLADACDIAPIQVSRILKRERQQYIKSLAKLIDGVGARLAFDSEKEVETVKEVCFADVERVNTPSTAKMADAHYIAVPVTDELTAARTDTLAQDTIRSWLMIWKHHESIRFTRNLVAIEVAPNDQSMSPTFCPGDLVLIDRSNRNPEQPGKSWLTCEPDGTSAIKRVSTKPRDGDLELIFYSDNIQEFPPTSYRLKRDFGGDIARAIAGRVVWAWSDMRNK